jgi:hypothetical protein
MLRLLWIVALLCIPQQSSLAQATKPDDESAPLYLRAATLVQSGYAARIVSPAASELIYHEYPPYPTEWYRMEKGAFSANTEARELAHQARSLTTANWPHLLYLNACRSLANDLADAAIYQHLQGDDAAAIETLRDLWHLADMLDDGSDKRVICLLVSIGIRELDLNRLMIITANVVLGKEPHDTKALQADVAREFIAQLSKPADAKTQMDATLHSEGANGKNFTAPQIDLCIELVNRVDAERDMAAMSLACHLYRFDAGAWSQDP